MFSARMLSGLRNFFGTVSTLFLLAAFLLPGEATAGSAALDKVIEGANETCYLNFFHYSSPGSTGGEMRT